MTAEMDNGIEAIDPQSAISSLFLPSVTQVPGGRWIPPAEEVD